MHGSYSVPADKKRKQATTFAGLTTRNISYFLNVDAAVQNQIHILAGDRDIGFNGSPLPSGLIQISDPKVVDWASILHKHAGNVALIDGSVHQVTRGQLRNLLDLTVTNRLIIP